MAQRRTSIWEGPLGELFKSTTEPGSAQAAERPVDRGGIGDAVRPWRWGERRQLRWRPTAVAVLGLATLELGVFIAVAVALLARPQTRTLSISVLPPVTRTIVVRSAPTPARPIHRKPPVVPLLPRTRTSVLVLNGNGISGAAARAAQIVRSHGYPVTATADAPQTDYPRSVVMYKPGFAREAKRLGLDLKIPTLSRLDPFTVPGRTRAGLVVIVGAGHD